MKCLNSVFKEARIESLRKLAPLIRKTKFKDYTLDVDLKSGKIVLLKKSEILPTTPCKRLEQHFLKKYGKFPINRMWQLDTKIRTNQLLSKRETMFVRVCLMNMHLQTDKNLFIDDDKFYKCSEKWRI